MLAIVIPYYKRTFFEATLQSLADQTDARFNVYIGDDASPENPLEIIAKYEKQFQLAYHRFESNLGGTSLTRQWERCITLAGGETWLMLLGDDDVLDPNVVAEFYKAHDIFVGKANLVRFASRLLNHQKNEQSTAFKHPEWESSTDFFYRKLIGKTRSSLSEYVFLKAQFTRFGFKDYPLGWHSDEKAWFDFSDNMPVYSINNAEIMIRVSDLSISGMTDNLEQKNKASMLFFRDILTENRHLFSKKQRLELLKHYEIAIKRKSKLPLQEWFFLGRMYAKDGNIITVVKCFRRFLISVLSL